VKPHVGWTYGRGVRDPVRVVQAGYDLIGSRYRDWSSTSEGRLAFVQQVLSQLERDSLVLELGCGPGEPATRLLAEVHRVIGVDVSSAQLRLAREAAPSAWLVQADMTRLSLMENSVDAVVSFYALGHVPSHQHAPLFAAIAHWLRPGGLLLTSTPLTAGDSVEDGWLGVPMFFGGIGAAATQHAVEDAGLTIERWDVVPEDEGDGKTVEFGWVTARRRASSPPAPAGRASWQ
jgi:cyclopropane fatty-acyl-phospholipid synthase-like methyltransferase